jgi:mitochondrial-processing peptidase subunit beta
MTPEEIERNIDAVTEKDVMNFAKQKIWDRDIAISALGRIEGLFDYMRIRGDMSRMLS